MAKGYWEMVLRIEGKWEEWENTLKITKVLTAVTIKITFFWNVTYSLLYK
jgi:hypothetical protein